MSTYRGCRRSWWGWGRCGSRRRSCTCWAGWLSRGLSSAQQAVQHRWSAAHQSHPLGRAQWRRCTWDKDANRELASCGNKKDFYHVFTAFNTVQQIAKISTIKSQYFCIWKINKKCQWMWKLYSTGFNTNPPFPPTKYTSQAIKLNHPI